MDSWPFAAIHPVSRQDYLPDIGLASCQGYHPPVAGIGDADKSLSMRRVKSGACGSMNHAAGAGGGWHCTAVGSIGGVE